jgi:asparagine synthase (glutamine-hydrolysing)
VTAIGGWVSSAPPDLLEESCRAIASGQAHFGGAPPALVARTGACFIGSSHVPGAADAAAAHGVILAAADARLDNVNDLARGLPALGSRGNPSSDAAFVALAWSQWGEGSLQRLIGDFAIAVFDENERRLVLARDPAGQRPLFYASLPDAAAFASMPSGLLGHPLLRRGWNTGRLAEALLDIGPQEDSYFAGICRVRPGECVVIDRRGVTVEKWWRPSLISVARLSQGELVDQYREVLNSAVRRRLPPNGPVACQLSSGYDSSAVAATAALLSDRPVTAFTSAPPSGFTGPVPKGRSGDESELAATTARQHGMDHHIVRGGALTAEFLHRQARTYQEPARNLLNGVWWVDILSAARASGATAMLNGSLGNITLNFGGLAALPEWIRRSWYRNWLRQAEATASRDDVSWRAVLFYSFAPWLPDTGWKRLRRRFLGIDETPAASLLHPDLHRTMDRRRLDPRPSGNTARDRLDWIDRLDPGVLNMAAIAEAGITECDPMADRELMEFSLTLPPTAFLDHGIYRPLARAALSDRVPAAVLDSRLRGLQSAHWPAMFTRETARQLLEEVEGTAAADILDLRRIGRLIEEWPEWRSYDLAVADLYSRKLPIALATGIFMKEFGRTV